MKRAWGKIFALGILIFLVAMALAAKMLEPDAESPRGSVASSETGGRRALFLLLGDLGVHVEAWREVPGSLPHEEDVLWLARPPQRNGATTERKKSADPEEPSDGDAETPEESKADGDDDGKSSPKTFSRPSPAASGMLSASHYRRFVEEGGTLILRDGDDARAFLVGELGIAACADVQRSHDSKAGPRKFQGASGEELELDVRAKGEFLAPAEGSGTRGLWRAAIEGGAGDDVLAAIVPAGRGRVVMLGDDAFLENSKIGASDHALFAVRLAEEIARGKRLLFDEYALGLWQARTPISILASPAWFLASLHVLLLIVLLVARSAWVREFPRDPDPLESASPLLRARTLAALLVRARRFDLLARLLREGMSRRIQRRVPEVAGSLQSLAQAPCGSLADLERLHTEISAIERRAG